MRISSFGGYALSGGVAVALLAGCGGSQMPTSAPIGADGAALPHAQTFNYTDSAQSFTVPAHVTLLTIVALGAAGGGDTNLGCAHTGRGGRVHAVISVTPGERLTIYVGGQGLTSGGGYNGGAPGAGSGSNGGGGASDVRVSRGGLHDRIVVAGGGGGTGGYVKPLKGDTYYDDGCGGNGGGLVGGHGYGYYDSYFRGGGGGGGGKQHHGGAGGKGGEGVKSYPNGQPGSHGVLGDGGVGGAGGGYTDVGAAGGGGAGGYYGGGGGGGGGVFDYYYAGGGGGGGGGSSYVESRAKSAQFWQGWYKATGNGLIVFSW
ncbi:MAG: hypothetical protein WAK16_05805 [Candidatus Cybelea sp.]